MASYKAKADFAKGIRAAREFADPPIKNRKEYAKRVLGLDSDSSGERLEAGELGKRKDNADARLQVAKRVIEITGCPPEVFGLSAPEPSAVDRLSQVVAQMSKAQNRLSAELAEAQKAQQGMLTRIEHLEHGGEEVH